MKWPLSCLQNFNTRIPIVLICSLSSLQELVEDVAVATSSRHADLSWARRFAVDIVRDSLAAGQPPRF